MSLRDTVTRHRADRRSDHPDGFDRRLIVPMVLGSILNPVNSSMIAVGLIPIGIALGAPPSETAWLVSALYLATAVGQPVVGRLIDLYGPRRLFLIGSALVGLGGVLGLLAPSVGVLVVARVLIGLGTCAGYPSAMYLIRSEAERTGRQSPAGILTVLAVSAQTVSVIGPTVGGFLIGLAGWRAIFAVNVPLAAVCLTLGAIRLPKHRPEDPSDAPRARLVSSIDLAGIALFVATLVSLLLFLLRPQASDWWLLVITAAAAVGFVLRERRAATPFVDLAVLTGNVPLLLTYARSLLGACVSYALLYGYTQWLEEGRGLSASTAGLVLLPIFAGAIAVSTLTGRNPRIRNKLLVGSVTQALVAAALLLLGPHTAIWALLALALFAGIPQGLVNLANQNAVYFQADPERIGSSAGLLRTFFYLGAISASVASGRFFAGGADSAGLHDLAWFMLVAAGLFVVITVVDRSLARVVPRDRS